MQLLDMLTFTSSWKSLVKVALTSPFQISGGLIQITLRLDYCGFGLFCSTGAKLLLSISLLMGLVCIIDQ